MQNLGGSRTSAFQDIADKPWIACDATISPFQNRIYAEYTDPSQGLASCTIPFCCSVKVKHSTDG